MDPQSQRAGCQLSCKVIRLKTCNITHLYRVSFPDRSRYSVDVACIRCSSQRQSVWCKFARVAVWISFLALFSCAVQYNTYPASYDMMVYLVSRSLHCASHSPSPGRVTLLFEPRAPLTPLLEQCCVPSLCPVAVSRRCVPSLCPIVVSHRCQ